MDDSRATPGSVPADTSTDVKPDIVSRDAGVDALLTRVKERGFVTTGEIFAAFPGLEPGCDARYDDRKFRLKANGASEAVLHTSAVKAGGKSAADLVGTVRPHKGEAVIGFGWATAEALVDGLSPTRK